MLVAVSGSHIRALTLLSERDTSSCDHCSEKGATVSKAAPPIIPSIPSFFTIGLPDDIAMDGGDAAHGPYRFATGLMLSQSALRLGRPPRRAPDPSWGRAL